MLSVITFHVSFLKHTIIGNLKKESVAFNIYIRILAFSDSFIWFGYFLFVSIAALHLEERLGKDPVVPITIGTFFYLFFRAIVQLPVSKLLDKNNSYKDEMFAIIVGGMLVSISFLGYNLVWSEFTLYFINIVFGIGAGIYLPAMRKTYSRFIKPGNEGFFFAFGDFAFALVGSFAALMGGVIVSLTGSYIYLFLASSLFTMMGALAPILLVNNIDEDSMNFSDDGQVKKE